MVINKINLTAVPTLFSTSILSTFRPFNPNNPPCFQVQVDWWGEGNRVELAGSFNGWEHHVYLLPELSSEIPQADGSRGPMLWKVDLWLYPGVFEIKFIVDGKWQLDHRRETVHRHMGHNNLLHVEL